MALAEAGPWLASALAPARVEHGINLVVGIDLGTTNTAACVGQPGSDELFQVPLDATRELKVPTVVALDRKTHDVVYFGNDCDQADPRDCWVFHRFKMHLYGERARATVSSVSDDGGERLDLPVQTVLAKVLSYVRYCACRLVEDKLPGLVFDRDQTRWVLTVPAIWSDHAKAVMRAAASEAGLVDHESSHRLMLALEPECAAIEAQQVLRILTPGQQFLVLDCGGGTVDTTAFNVAEIRPALALEQIEASGGGNWGSTLIDNAFLNLVERVLAPLVTHLELPELLGLLREFERVKKRFRVDSAAAGDGAGAGAGAAGAVVVPPSEVPVRRATDQAFSIVLTDLLEALDISKGQLRDLVVSFTHSFPESVPEGGLQAHRSALVLSHDCLMSLYDECLSKIGRHMDVLLAQSAVRRCTVFILAGGFAASTLLQHVVQTKAQTIGARLVVPPHVEGLIVRGAVRFGLVPQIIRLRVARYSYGVQTSALYDPVLHQGREGTWDDSTGQLREMHVFSMLVRKGDQIALDHEVQRTYYPTQIDRSDVPINVYISDAPDVCFTDQAGVRLLGTLHVPVNVHAVTPLEERELNTTLYFGTTELRIACTTFEGRTCAVPVAFTAGAL